MSFGGRSDLTIKPGTAEELAITINYHKLHNKFTRVIRVKTNDASNPNQLLTCKGEIRDAFKADKKRVNFGAISRHTLETSRKIVIERADGGALSPKLLPLKLKNVSAELKEITAGERYEIRITVRAPFTSRAIRSEVKFETGVPESPTGSVSFFATIKPHVSAQPRRISVPADPKPEWEVGVGLVWDDTKPHRITGATVDDPRMQVRLAEAGGRQRVVLKLLDGYQPKPGTRAVTISTDDGEAPEVRVPVVIRAAPRSVRPKATKGRS